MNYTDKLNGFNKTDKYHSELEFLTSLITKKGKILDYGCGTGYACDILNGSGLNVSGYDANHHNKDFQYSNATSKWSTVYFMHSIAHIEGIREVLRVLDTKEIIVITPNRQWINAQINPEYNPDKTVINHFTEYELIELFKTCGYSIISNGQFGEVKGNQMERLFIKAKKN